MAPNENVPAAKVRALESLATLLDVLADLARLFTKELARDAADRKK